MSDRRKVIAFAGGGSGGHFYPQVSVARELMASPNPPRIFFVSAKGSIEEKLIPREGFELYLISSGKLKGQSVLSILKTATALVRSVFTSIRIILRERPDMIFSAGGYAGAPFLVIGALFGIRCEILEQNRVPGLANRWMSRFCRRVYVNFPSSSQSFPGKETITVGHPCRPEFERARWGDKLEARLSSDPFRIFVFGGSQGAMGINRVVTSASRHLSGLPIEILHQTGEADYEKVKKEYGASGFTRARVEKYVYEMADALNDAHLVICRAGASSLAELAASEKAAILIPLVSKDRHQEHNAREMEADGAAIVYLQPSLTGEALAAKLKELYYNRKTLADLAKRMGRHHRQDAAARIAENILKG